MNRQSDRPVSILGVALPVEDWVCIRRTKLPDRAWISEVRGCREALARMAERKTDIVIAAPAMPDGTWKDLVASCSQFPDPPAVIVASRLADERLWAEVLNLGGYDLVAQPIEARELERILIAAMQQRASRGARSMTCREI